MDLAILLSVVVTFSTWLSIHVLLALAVARSLGKAQAGLGFLVCPMLPYFGYTSGSRKLSVAWFVFTLAYGLSLLAASR